MESKQQLIQRLVELKGQTIDSESWQCRAFTDSEREQADALTKRIEYLAQMEDTQLSRELKPILDDFDVNIHYDGGKVMKSADLTPRQKQVLPHLLSAPSIAKGAEAADICPKQVFQWLADDPLFREELNRYRNELFEDSIVRLKGATIQATETLIGLLNSPNDQVRRGVANDIINHATRFVEYQELDTRLSILEGK